jgi:xanthine permease
MIAGGLILVLLSIFRLVRYLEPLFTDNVIGVILILIGITLLPYLVPMVIGEQTGHPHGEPIILAVSALVILAIALFTHWLPGFPKTISLFLGIIFGTLLIWALGRLDARGLQEAYWSALILFFQGSLDLLHRPRLHFWWRTWQ